METHREAYLRKKGLDPTKSYSIEELAKISGVKKNILDEIAKRGRGAHSTHIRSVRIQDSFKKNPDLRRFPASKRLSAEQWAYARIFSFLNKGTTYFTADADLAKKSGY